MKIVDLNVLICCAQRSIKNEVSAGSDLVSGDREKFGGTIGQSRGTVSRNSRVTPIVDVGESSIDPKSPELARASEPTVTKNATGTATPVKNGDFRVSETAVITHL